MHEFLVAKIPIQDPGFGLQAQRTLISSSKRAVSIIVLSGLAYRVGDRGIVFIRSSRIR